MEQGGQQHFVHRPPGVVNRTHIVGGGRGMERLSRASVVASSLGSLSHKSAWLSSLPDRLLNHGDHSDDPVQEKGQNTFRAADMEMNGLVHGSQEWRDRQAYVQGSLLNAFREKHGGFGFGTLFSDHMMTVEYRGQGLWSRPRITPLEPVVLHPASQVLHYGMSCFEGMKVYRNARDPSMIQFFRPMLNMERLLRSAQRLNLPPFCPHELLECIRMLVRMDEGWVPKERGQSLYIRPVLYSSSDMLGVTSPQKALLHVIMSPSGQYFEKDVTSPIRMYIEEEYRRAWPGGAGDSKVSGNYAPTIHPQALAKTQFGADQVVFTSTRHNVSYFEECGAMNIFFVFRHDDGRVEVATPSLSHGTILPGVTRQSIVEIVQEWSRQGDDIFASERNISVDEVQRASDSQCLLEMFACGTASVVQPIGSLIRGQGEEILPFSNGNARITSRIYDALVDIHHGIQDSQHSSWTVPV